MRKQAHYIVTIFSGRETSEFNLLALPFPFPLPVIHTWKSKRRKALAEGVEEGCKIDLKKQTLKPIHDKIVHIPRIPGISRWFAALSIQELPLPPSLPFVLLIQPFGSVPASFHSCF